MSVNRTLWVSQFGTFPSWLCPTCQSGNLSLAKDGLKYSEPGYSKAARSEDPWEPDWIEERFSALLNCANTMCGEVVAVVGRTHHVEDHDWDKQEQHWAREFQPTFLTPPPPVFPIPTECPEAVSDELRKAFALLWSDAGSCANRLRTAVEVLLTDRKVPGKRRSKKNRKWVRMDLHSRVEKFREKDSETAEYLLAIKWLGNVGSHTDLDALTVDDLLNGFELFEHVIQLVYVKHERKMKKIAKTINSRKGRPIRRKQKTSGALFG